MDEVEESTIETVGEQLRKARKKQKLSLDAVAAQTRIPTRHLESIENSDWSALPAPTYSVGFAKNYAAVVGLDRERIAEQLRTEMGGMRAAYTQAEVYQPADPKRSMPKWLILGAIVALAIVVGLLNWNRHRDLAPAASPVENGTSSPAGTLTAPAAPVRATPAAAPAASATGPVSIVATDAPVWIRVRADGKTLKIGTLAAGERFDVPVGVAGATLDAGRPEGLRITVGGQQVPPIGKPGRPVTKVSLAPADLSRGGSAPTAGPPATGVAPAPASGQ